MKFGDILNGKCPYCRCERFTYLGQEGKENYFRVICRGCHIVQWLKVE